MTIKRPISKSDMARLCGVSAAAITKACNHGGLLHEAMDGKRIDAAHPVAAEYLRRHGADAGGIPEPAAPKAKPARKPKAEPKPAAPAKPHMRGKQHANEARKAAATEPADPVVPENVAEYADMTLRDLIAQFGTDVRFGDWLKALKSIEEVREKRLKNAEREGELIPRDLVRQFVVAKFEEAHIQLMTDVSQTLAIQVSAMAAAGADMPECKKYVSETIGKVIRSTKGTVTRVLRDAG